MCKSVCPIPEPKSDIWEEKGNEGKKREIKPPSCLTDPERYAELLERYREE